MSFDPVTLFWKWWKALLGAVLMFPVAFLLGQCDGKAIGKKRAEAAAAVATVEVLKTDGRAKEKAAGERLADAEAVADLEGDLTDAVASLPDDVPSLRRVARACAQLRAQGLDTGRLPACGGPPNGPQAPARP